MDFIYFKSTGNRAQLADQKVLKKANTFARTGALEVLSTARGTLKNMGLLMAPSPEMAMTVVSRDHCLTVPGFDEACDEVGIYDGILSAYERLEERGGDRVTTGSLLAVKLAQIARAGGIRRETTARNGYLLLLALFFLGDDQAMLMGRDFAGLERHERENLLKELAGALP